MSSNRLSALQERIQSMQKHLAHLNTSLDNATAPSSSPYYSQPPSTNASMALPAHYQQAHSMIQAHQPPQAYAQYQPAHQPPSATVGYHTVSLSPQAHPEQRNPGSVSANYQPASTPVEATPGEAPSLPRSKEPSSYSYRQPFIPSQPQPVSYINGERSVSASTIADWAGSGAMSRTGSMGVSSVPRANPPTPTAYAGAATFHPTQSDAWHTEGHLSHSASGHQHIPVQPHQQYQQPPQQLLSSNQWTLFEAQQQQLQRQEAMMAMLLEQQVAMQRHMVQQPTSGQPHQAAARQSASPERRASSTASTSSATSNVSTAHSTSPPTKEQPQRFYGYNVTRSSEASNAGFAPLRQSGTGSPAAVAAVTKADPYKGMSLEEMQEALRQRLVGGSQRADDGREVSVAASEASHPEEEAGVPATTRARVSTSPSPTPTKTAKPSKVAIRSLPTPKAVAAPKPRPQSPSADIRRDQSSGVRKQPHTPTKAKATKVHAHQDAADTTPPTISSQQAYPHEVSMTGAEVFAVLRLRGLISSNGDTGERHLPPSRCHKMQLTDSEYSQLKELRQALEAMQQQYRSGSEEDNEGRAAKGNPQPAARSSSTGTLSRWKM